VAYQMQWRRAQRWLSRIADSPPADHMDYEDFMWAFFQNCWHLKDWIKHDKNLPNELCQALDAEIRNLEPLQTCADIANGGKHFALDRPRDGKGASPSHKNFDPINGEPDRAKVTIYIARGDGNRIEAIALAKEAMQAWRRLLEKYGVQPP
jgi:hypothetical protein